VKAQIQRVFDSLRDFITDHHYADTPILTARVGVDSTDSDNRLDRPAWLITLKNEAKRIEADQCLEEMTRRDTKRQRADIEEAILSHLQDTKRQVAADAAQEIYAHFTADNEFKHISFGGNLKMAHAVKHALHPAIYDHLFSIERIAYESPPNEIAEIVKRVADDTEAERDFVTVDELIARRHVCGTAVLEWQGVMTAVEQGQANRVIVSVPFDSDKFDELMLKSVLANCEIGFVHGEAAKKLNEFGGVAATLYYLGR